MNGKKDRGITLRQVIVHQDEKGSRVFTHDSVGQVLSEVRGKRGAASDRVITLSDSGQSIAEEKEKGTFSQEAEIKLWQDFINWIKKMSP